MKPEWCPPRTWQIAKTMAICGQMDRRDHGQKAFESVARLLNSALLDAHQRGLQQAIDWHRKNAKGCREIAGDEPRLPKDIRDRAEIAANQHAASAAGIEALMIEDRRAKTQEVKT